MSQQGPDVAKRNKKRKLKPARPLLEQLPAVPAEAPEQQHKHKKPHRQQQPPEQPQEQQPDALNAGNSKFARALGSTDFHTREQGLQALSRWLTHKQLVSELDMLKLWKGIYFCFWHSDKEPVQEDLAERLAGLIPRMQPGMAVLYWSAMLSTLRSQWFSLDRHRLNKFLMLVRKFVGAVFTRLAAEDWPITSIQSFTSNLPLVGSVMPLTQARSLGLSYHLADVWLPELRKAAGAKALRQEALQALLEPFVGVLQQSGEAAFINRVRESVLEAIVQDLAAAAGAGGAGSSSDDDESDSTAWAYCQQLDVTAYASLLFDRGAQEGVRSRNREALYSISKDLERLAGKRRKAAAAAAAAAGGGGSTAGAAAAAGGSAAAGGGSVKKQKHRVQQEQGLQQDGQLQQQQPESGKKVKKQKHAQQQQQQQQVEEPMANGHVEQPSSSKKQKKQAQQQQQQVVEPAVAAVTPDSSHALTRQHKQATAGKKQGTPAAAAAAAAGSASALKRGVKIDLKKNLYFEHGAPPPAAEIRTPPKAKPKGSALKSAVQLDSSGRPAGASTAPAGAKQNGAQRRLVTPSSVPRLKASEFF